MPNQEPSSPQAGIYSQVTRDIKVTVLPSAMAEQSDPEGSEFAFAYTVTIHNAGKETVQLLERHWVIVSNGEQIGEVRSKEYARLSLPKEDNPVRFDGPPSILIGPYTYSAAIQFAVAAQDYGIAKFAGEETGGFSCQTGRTTTIPMPRTGLNAFAPRLAIDRKSVV